ncbi:MAG TPA: hypothetical protein VNA13_02605, partial [Xanthomonadales bacterium]|nr:hypothetical protein [Xanthomonadales bacterium]
MNITNLLISKKINVLTFSANVAFKGSQPERMYFSTDLKNQQFINADYSPFLAAVLLPCMKTGEDIVVKGFVSKKLLENTEKIMDLVVGWNVGLRRINVIPAKAGIHPKRPSQEAGSPIKSGMTNHASFLQARTISPSIASFFSAGVDSFYTYLKHKNKKDKISSLILVHGFDIPLENKILFAKTKKTVEKIAEVEKVNAICVKTNVGEIIEKHLIWDFAHGGALAAVGLFLGLNKIFIPAGLRKDELFPYGTHPNLDKLWSTEKTVFTHDGTEYNRLGKIMNVVGKSPLALKYLRVCTQNIKGKYNCSRCYKCLQTMIELVCANALHKVKTFDRLDLKAVSNM